MISKRIVKIKRFAFIFIFYVGTGKKRNSQSFPVSLRGEMQNISNVRTLFSQVANTQPAAENFSKISSFSRTLFNNGPPRIGRDVDDDRANRINITYPSRCPLKRINRSNRVDGRSRERPLI